MKLSDLVDFLDDPSQFEIHYKGSKVEYLNEAGSVSDSSRFFVAGFEFGASVLVHVESYRGDGFESAWTAWIDSMPEIEKDEYPEAYGLSRGESFHDMAWDEMRADCPNVFSEEGKAYVEKIRARGFTLLQRAEEDARNGNGEWPECIEGYEMDSSGNVKSVGHYAWMNEADLDEIEIVRKEENPSK